MNLEHIRTYLTVLHSGGFRDAARQLGISQPTVTLHIKKLEDSVGQTLIVRERAGCFPAPGSEAFVRYAEGLVRLAERARLSLQQPHLTIGAAGNLGIYLLQPYFRSFADQQREVARLDMVIDRNDRILDKLESGEVDVAALEWWDDRRGFVATVWREEPAVVIVPSDHPWAGLASIRPVDLVGEPMIGGEAHTGTGRMLRNCLGDIAERLTIRCNLGSTEAVKSAVRAGLGISIVLEASVSDELAAKHLVSVPLNGVRLAKRLYVARSSSLPSNGLAARFAQHLER